MTSRNDSPYARLKIGVFALQGAFAKHLEVLARLGVPAREVRNAADLEGLDGLIIPGGETTTMTKIMKSEGMIDSVARFGATHPVMGTCAGMVFMGRDVGDPRVHAFGWMPIKITRNAYGSQVDSFRDVGTVKGIAGHPEMEMVFIRAPQFEPASDEVEVIGTCRGLPVAARCGGYLATAFHPELTDDDRLHRLWLDAVLERSAAGRIQQGLSAPSEPRTSA
jgi:5'-phosphate synthase pdxT subunit